MRRAERRGQRLAFSNDFILKAGLMLAGIAGVGFKVENFTRASMAKLEEAWSGICGALVLTVELAASFGLGGQGRWAESSLLPVAYYLYHSKAPGSFVTHGSKAKDRSAYDPGSSDRSSSHPGWGSGLDTLLTRLRAVMQADTGGGFPAAALEEEMRARGKALAFSDPEVDLLLDAAYPDYRAFLLLSLLYPFVDLKNHFHVDHVFPRSMLTPSRLRKAGVAQASVDDLAARCDRLPNLQHLGGAENNEKRAKLPNAWLQTAFDDPAVRADYVQRHDLGVLPDDASSFARFYDERRAAMRGRLGVLLGTSAA